MWNGKEPTLEQQIVYNAQQTHIDLNGGIRGGKTQAALEKARKEALLQPGIKILITRDTGPVLYTTTKLHFESVFADVIEEDQSWEKPTPRYKLRNGTWVFLIAYDDLDTSKAGGTEYGFIIIDESSRMKYGQYIYFKGRLSQTVGDAIAPDGHPYKNKITRRHIVTVHNPAGRGWEWQTFVRDHPDASILLPQPEPKLPTGKDPHYLRVNFDTATLQSVINPDYLAFMQDIPAHLKGRLLEHDESPLEGLVFPQFKRELNVCNIPGFVPPNHWIAMAGMDWGKQTPCVHHWGAVTEEGCIIIFSEHRQAQMEVEDHTKIILEKTLSLRDSGMGEIRGAYIDPSTDFDDGKSQFTVYRQFINAGYWNLQKAPRLPVEHRATRLGSLLLPNKNIKKHPITDEYREEGWPKLIFTSDCAGTIREFESWEYPKNRGEAKDPKNKPEEKNDHGIDATGYIVVNCFNDMTAPPHPATVEYDRMTTDAAWREKVQADFDKSKKGTDSKKSSPSFGRVY